MRSLVLGVFNRYVEAERSERLEDCGVRSSLRYDGGIAMDALMMGKERSPCKQFWMKQEASVVIWEWVWYDRIAHPHQDTSSSYSGCTAISVGFCQGSWRGVHYSSPAWRRQRHGQAFSASARVSIGRSLTIFLKWKKEVLHSCLTWVSKVRWESILTPKLITDVESGIFWPEKVILEITDVWIWCGVPTRMASVFELFNCRKFWLIQASTSSRQVVMVEDDRAAEVDELVLR